MPHRSLSNNTNLNTADRFQITATTYNEAVERSRSPDTDNLCHSANQIEAFRCSAVVMRLATSERL
ncbi:MAG: hypothetical protein ACRC8A_02115 [Microcoleaceae cyanobacterium]